MRFCSSNAESCIAYWNCKRAAEQDFGILAGCFFCSKVTWVRVKLEDVCEDRSGKSFAVLKCPYCGKKTPALGPNSVKALEHLQKTRRLERFTFPSILPLLFKEIGPCGDGPIPDYLTYFWAEKGRFTDWNIRNCDTILACFGNLTVKAYKCDICKETGVLFLANAKNRKALCKNGQACGFSLTCMGRSVSWCRLTVCPKCRTAGVVLYEEQETGQ